MLSKELIERIDNASSCNRDDEVVYAVDGFVDEVDFEFEQFYINGSEIPFDDFEEDDFTFYSFNETNNDMDDVFEFVKAFKKVEKSIQEINRNPKKLYMFMSLDMEWTSAETLEEMKSLDTLSELGAFELYELKKKLR